MAVRDIFSLMGSLSDFKIIVSLGILPTGVMDSLAERVRNGVWGGPQLQVITSAASLAHQGLLGSVEHLWLRLMALRKLFHWKLKGKINF